MESRVSSFYGRRPSADPLNADLPPGAGRPEQRNSGATRDDASSFFNPEKGALDRLNDTRMSAGYNQGSYFNAGREEPVKGGKDEREDEEAWDVYADFNNAGPRYSTNLGLATSNGYQQLATPKPVAPQVDYVDPTGNKVEMVTVPAMGAEWGKEELRGMTKKARKQEKSERRREFWKSWNRDQRGLCGKYFTRKVLAFTMFGMAAVIGLVLAFTIPRVPKFTFNSSMPMAPATGDWATAVPTIFSRSPANFSFPAMAALQLDTDANFLPLQFTSLKAQVFDIDTDRKVGEGDLGKRKIPAKGFPRILLPLNITYEAANNSDTTWMNWYAACRNKETYADGRRTPLKVRLLLEMSIIGLVGHPKTTIQINDAECPIELPLNAG